MDNSAVSLKLCMASQASMIESLLNDNDIKDESIHHLENRLAEFQNKQNQLENSNSELHSINQRLDEENQSIKAKSQSFEQKLHILENEKLGMENQIRTMNGTISNLQKERDDYKQSIEDIRYELDDFQDIKSRNEELSKENTELQQRVSSFEYDLNTTQIENNKLQQQIEELQYKCRQCEKDNSDLNVRIKASEESSTNQMMELKHREQLIEQYKREIDEKSQTIFQLNTTNRQQKMDNDLLRQECSSLSSQLQSKEQELSQSIEGGQSASFQLASLQQANTSLNTQFQRVLQRAAYLVRSVQRILPSSSGRFSQLEEVNEAIVQEENDLVNTTVQEFQQWGQNLQGENQRMQERVVELEREIARMEQEMEGKQSEMGMVSSEINQLKSDLNEKNQLLRKTDNKLADLRRMIETKEQTIQSLTVSNDTVSALKQQLAIMEKTSEEKITDLVNQHNKLVDEYSQLEQENEARKQSVDEMQKTEHALKGRISQLQQIVERMTSTSEQSQLLAETRDQEITTLQQQVEEAQQKWNQAVADCQQLQQQLDQVMNENQAIRQDNEAALQTKQRVEAQHQSFLLQTQQDRTLLQNQIEDLTERLNLANKELEEVKHELNIKKMELNRTLASNQDSLVAKLQETVKDAENQIHSLQQTIQEYKNSNSQLAMQIQEMEEELNQLRLHHTTASSEMTTSQQKLQTLIRAVRSVMDGDWSHPSLNVSLYNDSLAEISNEDGPMVNEIVHSLQEWNQKRKEENASMKERLLTMENTLNKQQMDLKEHNVQVEGEWSRLQKEIELREAEIDTKNRSLVQLQKSLNEQMDQNQVLQNQLESIQEEYQRAQKQVEDYSKQVLDLRIQQATVGSTHSPSLANQLQDMQSQLMAAKNTLSSKELRVVTLESELATTKARLEEAVSTLQLLEASLDKLKASQAKPTDLVQVEQLKMEKKHAEEQRDQYMQMYTSMIHQVEAKTSEIAQLKQIAQIKEQEYARRAALQSTTPLDATVNQYLETIRLKDQRIFQLEGENQQLMQAKRDADLAATQARQAEAYRAQFNASHDSAAVLELRAQLLAKQQEIASLQQQLQTEIGLVKNMKASYLELDKMLSERMSNQSSSLQALLKAKEDHNTHLEKMVASLEAELRDARAHMPVTTPLAPAVTPVLQSIISQITPFFPESSITPTSLLEYIRQLCQLIQDERTLYANLRKQFDELQKEKGDLTQKVLILQNYANGHNQIDKKADTFIQDLIRQRNDFEQQFKNAVFEKERKDTEVQQLRRSLKQEKETNVKLLKKKSAVPEGFSSLMEECKNICMLAKIDNNHKLDTVKDVVEVLKLVRRGIAGMLNLFKRENERLSFENKRLKELSETSKQNEERINKKIKDIIHVLQNQGVALKEFVIAFQSIRK